MADMDGAYPVADLLKVAAIGLLILLAAALLITGTLIGKENRRRFILWSVGIYAVGWTVFLLYDTYQLIRYFFGLRR